MVEMADGNVPFPYDKGEWTEICHILIIRGHERHAKKKVFFITQLAMDQMRSMTLKYF